MDEWAIQILGEEQTLERLGTAIGGLGDIRVDADKHFLVHPNWQAANNWEEAEAEGRAFLAHTNGLLRLRGETQQLRFGGVVRLKSAGGRDYFDAATVVVRMTPSAVEEHIGADGLPVPPPPDPLPSWLAVAEADERLQEALGIFANASDWTELYKVYEVIRKALGNEKAIEALISAPLRRRFTQTANHFRHANVSLPGNPMGFDEGVEVVGRLLVAWMKQVQS